MEQQQRSDLNAQAVPWPGPTHATTTTGAYVLQGNVSNHPAWIRPPNGASILRHSASPFEPAAGTTRGLPPAPNCSAAAVTAASPSVPAVPQQLEPRPSVPRWFATDAKLTALPEPIARPPTAPRLPTAVGSVVQAPPQPPSSATAAPPPAGKLLFDGRMHMKHREPQLQLRQPYPARAEARSASLDSASDDSDRRIHRRPPAGGGAPLYSSHAISFPMGAASTSGRAPSISSTATSGRGSLGPLSTPPVTGADFGAIGTPVPKPTSISPAPEQYHSSSGAPTVPSRSSADDIADPLVWTTLEDLLA